MGHLPAFGWNTLRPFIRHAPFNAAYDYLFSRGIDPDVEDPTVCHAHPPPPPVWPPLPAIAAYRDDVRARIVGAVAQLPGAALAVAVEHDAMHVETLLYMAAQRRGAGVCRGGRAASPPPTAYTLSAAVEAGASAAARRQRASAGGAAAGVVTIPAGWATLGRPRPADLEPGRNFGAPAGGNDPPAGSFGWDNEFPATGVMVGAFAVAALPVTVGAYAAFMAGDGYGQRRWWGEEDWRWVGRAAVAAPASWAPVDAAGDEVRGGPAEECNGGGAAAAAGWAVRTVDGVLVPLAEAAAWPVAVSLAEARAYAAWAGGRLPTEAEWHRAAYATPAPAGGGGDGGAVPVAAAAGGSPPWPYPWGVAAPTPGVHGNFGCTRRHPADVGSYPAGASALGVRDLVGDGWEWTATVFSPFEGFQAHPSCTSMHVALCLTNSLLGGRWCAVG